MYVAIDLNFSTSLGLPLNDAHLPVLVEAYGIYLLTGFSSPLTISLREMQKKLEIVYVVDDDDIYQYVIKKKIEKRNIANQIKTFKNGHDAIEYLNLVANSHEKLPDVIFLDINMPVMDGWDFLQEYTELKSRLKKKINLYVVSSSIHQSDIERAKNIREVTDYIIKPMNDEQLDEILVSMH